MLINQMPGLALDSTTAIASDILSGKTVYDGEGNLITGTITSKSASTYAASTSNQTISAGQYLSGAQTIAKVNVPAASSILSGSSITSNGNTLVSGSMANNGAYTATTSYQGTVTIPAGYHNGSGYIRGGSASYAGATIDASKVLNGYKGWDSSGNLITGSYSSMATLVASGTKSDSKALTIYNESNVDAGILNTFVLYTFYQGSAGYSNYFCVASCTTRYNKTVDNSNVWYYNSNKSGWDTTSGLYLYVITQSLSVQVIVQNLTGDYKLYKLLFANGSLN